MAEGLGLRVLVVDDEALITMLIEDMLDDLGCSTVGPAYQLGEALELARAGDFDCAILDLNLSGKSTDSVAEVLRGRGIPFAVASGYVGGDLGPAFAAAPVLQKPFNASHMGAVLEQLANTLRRRALSE